MWRTAFIPHLYCVSSLLSIPTLSSFVSPFLAGPGVIWFIYYSLFLLVFQFDYF